MPETVVFDFFGTLTRVVFKYEACADGVARYYESCVANDVGRTVDVVIEVDWPAADKYLFRARPETADGTDLDGVRVREFGDRAMQSWTSRFQPLPPFNGRTMRNRFVGLHAGTAVLPDGQAILVVGERGAGKSTFIREVCRTGSVAFGGDESCVLVAGTAITLPFPHAISLVDPDDIAAPKQYHPAASTFGNIASSAAAVQSIIVVERDDHGDGRIRPMAKSRAFTHLVSAHRDFGVPAHVGLATLYDLLSSVDVRWLRWRDVADLRDAAGLLAKTVAEDLARV